MARPFTDVEARGIIQEHHYALQNLKKGSLLTQKYQAEIKKSADTIITKQLLKILQEIPIEEINREKRGFRIKVLRENGYNTIADIATASVYSIASMRGIGEDTACMIKNTVDGIVSLSAKGVKLKLSTDNKTPEATSLISAILKYSQSQSIVTESQKLLAENEPSITTASNDLAGMTSKLKWFFSSAEKKQTAIRAYQYLQEAKSGNYGKKATQLLQALLKINKSREEAAWKYFVSNPVGVYNILEKIYPGVLGNDDTVYGLPEELARGIQEESFFPDGLLCELRRYQEWGVKYILHQERVLLGDEMGLGKTIQAIATMVSLRNTGATHFMVVCPASVITNWCREVRERSKLSVTKIHGPDREKAFQSWRITGGVAVTTYETTAHLLLADDFRFSLLVVDEAHYIKNPKALRTLNVKKLCSHAERLLFMTGTALENKVGEMIALVSILRPRIARRLEGMTFLSSAPQFQKEVAPVYYRRKREDVLTELPDLIESKEWCALGTVEEREYECAVLAKKYADVRRVSWNVDDLKESSKAHRLLELVEEAESEGRKIIVFSFFLDTIRKVTQLLGSRCADPINGAVPPQRRQEIIDEFDNSSNKTVLVAQIQSGGTGLNIQSASVVILCEPQFKPSIENQAISRAYRMGQTRNVIVYRLLCENTVDEKILSALKSKQEIFDAFADKSIAASESMELDNKTFGEIIKEEINRINEKNGQSITQTNTIQTNEHFHQSNYNKS